MTNQNLYDLVNFVMRKNGVSEPLTGQRFELLLQQENKNHYKDMVTTYMKSQKVMDSLSPFEVKVQVSTLAATTTTIDLPTDYAHFVGMYHTDDDSIVRAFDMVTDDQWDMRCRNRITVPTIHNPICKIVKSKIYVNPVLDQVSFSDWFLPSLQELEAMYTNLHAESVGGFSNEPYWSSTEYDSTTASIFNFLGVVGRSQEKASTFYIRACRSFTDVVGAYSLLDIGPAGGYIFYIDGTTYYEAAPSDQSTSKEWSNITSTSIGTTSVAIGEGQNNTNEIIAQSGHTDSCAKLCDDLIITI